MVSKTILAGCACLGLFGWWLYAMSFRSLPGQDWMVFQTAVAAWREGDAALLLHGGAFTARLNAAFAGWIPGPFALKPWVYPPSYLLLFLPFGLLPPAVSYPVFEVTTLLLLVLTLVFCEHRLGRRPRPALVIASLALSPATAWTVLVGQNAFLTTALLLAGALLVLDRRPVLGGLLLGVLTVKPQLWLMVPVMLLALRDWRAMLSCAAGSLGLALASLVAFGPGLWLGWFDLLLGRGAEYAAWLPAGRLTGASITACAVRLGASPGAAAIAQALGALAAAAAVFLAFRKTLSDRRRLAVLLTATVLSAPHVSQYDMVMLGVAATLLLRDGEERGFAGGQLTLCVLLWAAPIVNPPIIFALGAATPLLLLLGLAAMLLTGGRAAPTARSPTLRSPTLGSPTLRSPTLRSPAYRAPRWRFTASSSGVS